MIQAGFIFLTIIMALLLYAGMASAATKAIPDTTRRKRFQRNTLLLILGWLTYVTLISFTGVLATTALPPRIPLMLIFPCFLFMIYFFRSAKFKDIIAAVPTAWLTYAQSFRVIVELLLHALYLKGMLPKAATFEGYNYEIAIGITALVVGYWGFTKRSLPVSVIRLWNYCGLVTLAIVVFIVLSHAYFPGIYVHPEHLSIEAFGSFPYTLLAGFLMPLAVFMHMFSLVKLRSAKVVG